MFEKSIRERSASHVGMGRSAKWRYAFTRTSVIHSGSRLCAEISRTISSSRPLRVRKIGSNSSWKPNRYSPIAVAWASSGVSSVLATDHRLLFDTVGCVAVALQLVRDLGPAGAGDAALHEHVDDVRLDVVQEPRVVRDHEHAHLRPCQVVHAVGDDPERVDVEARI